MKRVAVLLALVLSALAFAAPAQANGKPPIYTTVPHAPIYNRYHVAAATGAPCPGVPSRPTSMIWDFSEPAGSHGPFKETLSGGNSALNLNVYSYGGTATGTGASVGFTDNAIIKTAGNIFNPENGDFVMCTYFSVNDPNGYNLSQINNSYPQPSDHGMIKQTGWYNQPGGTLEWFKVKNSTCTPAPCHVVTGTELNGTGYHSTTIWRHGNVYTSYFDGVLSDSKTKVGIGPVHLDAPLVVGGKYLEGGGTVEAGDLLKGNVSLLRIG